MVTLPSSSILIIVPDRPPTNISTHSLGTDEIEVSWNPVPSEYTNGKVLGYNVFYNEVDDLSSANSSLVLQEKHSKINRLKPNTNYSFQVLAFTAKGNGPKSKAYFAKTLSGNNFFSYLLIHLSLSMTSVNHARAT